MNKKIVLAMVALVAVSIVLASGVVAQLVGGANFPPSQPPIPEENSELVDEIMAEITDQGGMTTRAEISSAISQAQAMGADLSSTTVKTSADFGENEMSCCGIHECEWHLYCWVCPPVYETHAALLWNECTNSDLDLYICNTGGYAVSNAANTLTEEVAITGCGVNYIWVHGTKVTPYSSYQPYALSVDCELPKICSW